MTTDLACPLCTGVVRDTRFFTVSGDYHHCDLCDLVFQHPTEIYDVFFAPDAAVLRGTYDFVTCREVVEHLNTPLQEFALFETLLARGGWLGIMTELRRPVVQFAGWYYHRDPTHVSFYSGATMRWIASRFGWEIDLLQPRVTIFRVPARS